MQIVPLQPVPNQSVNVALGGQLCQVNVYTHGAAGHLYVDLLVDNVLIIGGVIGWNLNRIVRSLYLGFSGDLCFCDNMGDTDPVYTGLGPDASSRFNLLYVTAAELGGQG